MGLAPCEFTLSVAAATCMPAVKRTAMMPFFSSRKLEMATVLAAVVAAVVHVPKPQPAVDMSRMSCCAVYLPAGVPSVLNSITCCDADGAVCESVPITFFSI